MLEGGQCPFIERACENKEYLCFRNFESTWRFFTLEFMIVFANFLVKIPFFINEVLVNTV